MTHSNVIAFPSRHRPVQALSAISPLEPVECRISEALGPIADDWKNLVRHCGETLAQYAAPVAILAMRRHFLRRPGRELLRIGYGPDNVEETLTAFADAMWEIRAATKNRPTPNPFFWWRLDDEARPVLQALERGNLLPVEGEAPEFTGWRAERGRKVWAGDRVDDLRERGLAEFHGGALIPVDPPEIRDRPDCLQMAARMALRLAIDDHRILEECNA